MHVPRLLVGQLFSPPILLFVVQSNCPTPAFASMEPDEPPRKNYGFKDRAFQRDNPLSSDAPPLPTAQELAKMAGGPAPAPGLAWRDPHGASSRRTLDLSGSTGELVAADVDPA